MYGIGLVLAGCHVITRFAYRYYQQHKADYTTEQQGVLEALFNAAAAVEALLTEVMSS